MAWADSRVVSLGSLDLKFRGPHLDIPRQQFLAVRNFGPPDNNDCEIGGVVSDQDKAFHSRNDAVVREEEDSANDIVQKIKLMGDAQGGMFMLDRELGQRVFTAPADET